MTSWESWEDPSGKRYAVVRPNRQDQKEYRLKAYEAVWLDEDGELGSLAGSVGFRLADFVQLAAAHDFLLKGMAGYDENTGDWVEQGGRRVR